MTMRLRPQSDKMAMLQCFTEVASFIVIVRDVRCPLLMARGMTESESRGLKEYSEVSNLSRRCGKRSGTIRGERDIPESLRKSCGLFQLCVVCNQVCV
jgi:hypothetical protein